MQRIVENGSDRIQPTLLAPLGWVAGSQVILTLPFPAVRSTVQNRGSADAPVFTRSYTRAVYQGSLIKPKAPCYLALHMHKHTHLLNLAYFYKWKEQFIN